MNWKTIRHLVNVDVKSSRLLRGQRLAKYNVARNRFFNYLTYVVAIAIGLAVEFWLACFTVPSCTPLVFKAASMGLCEFADLPSHPHLSRYISFHHDATVPTQRNQLFSPSALLAAHHMARTHASIYPRRRFGHSFAFNRLHCTCHRNSLLIHGQVPLALGASLAMCASAFMAATTTEAFRVLQVRFTGAVYKSTGKAAIWVRFTSTLLFFIVFYIVYSYVIYGTGIVSFIQTVASLQTAAWFIPFVWVGLTLAFFASDSAILG